MTQHSRPDLHVLPIDGSTHEETRECWCHPSVDRRIDPTLVVHHAADGRELVEEFLEHAVISYLGFEKGLD